MADNVRAAFEHRAAPRLPRGELWIASQVFAERGLDDSVEGHLALCGELGMDLLSLPVGREGNAGLGYRLFDPSAIEKAARDHPFVVAVLSGPFQRIADSEGLSLALATLAKDPEEARAVVGHEAEKVSSLIDLCAGHGASAIVIAEDLAYNSGAFLTPAMFLDLFCPRYSEFVDGIHRRGAYAVHHSCGKIGSLVPNIVSSGFNGLSCQEECVDLFSLREEHGHCLTLFAGLSRGLLEARSLTARLKSRFVEEVSRLGASGGLVLSSSTGLLSQDMVSNAQQLYRLADGAWERPGPPLSPQ